MIRVTANEIRGKTKEELLAELDTLKAELLRLRVCKATKSSPAAVRTIAALLEQYKGKKLIPKDLRPNTTRASRRMLTKAELSVKTKKQVKLDSMTAKRVFALKA